MPERDCADAPCQKSNQEGANLKDAAATARKLFEDCGASKPTVVETKAVSEPKAEVTVSPFMPAPAVPPEREVTRKDANGTYWIETSKQSAAFDHTPFMLRPATIGFTAGGLIARDPRLSLGLLAAGSAVNSIHDSINLYNAGDDRQRIKYGIATAADIAATGAFGLASAGFGGRYTGAVAFGAFCTRFLIDAMPDRIIKK